MLVAGLLVLGGAAMAIAQSGTTTTQSPPGSQGAPDYGESAPTTTKPAPTPKPKPKPNKPAANNPSSGVQGEDVSGNAPAGSNSAPAGSPTVPRATPVRSTGAGFTG